MPIPVVVLSTTDPVLRDSALFSILTDLPGTGVLRQELDPVAGTVRRSIGDEHGTVEDRTAPLEHACLGCALREDALPALDGMVGSGRWDRIVLALPVSAQTPPAARALSDPDTAARIGIELTAVVTVVDADAMVSDLFGDDLLADRGLALSDDDRRSVGEAVALQIGHADLVLTSGSDPVGRSLTDHLRGVRTTRSTLFTGTSERIFAARYVAPVAEARIDPRLVVPPDAVDGNGVWSLDLSSRRPLHPRRFADAIPLLAAGRVRSRGRFHLAGRPGTVGMWDGAGSQLSIGDAGGWEGFAPSTRLVFTGIDDSRVPLMRAFAGALLTDKEIAAGPQHWATVDDGLDPWLGERRLVC
jgi:G3E family GTPase